MLSFPFRWMVQCHRSFHISPLYCKAKAGRYKVSKFNNKPLTYDQAFKPHNIAVTKGWLTMHTGNLRDEKDSHARTYEEQFIRRFMEGTFHRMLPTHLVIKRRCNILEVIAFINSPKHGDKIFFLKAYSEKILSAFLKCNVKLYMYHVEPEDMHYKYI